MSYMIEGGSSTAYMKAKRWLFVHPEESHVLLQKITDVVIQYLIGQVKAGAQVLYIVLPNSAIYIYALVRMNVIIMKCMSILLILEAALIQFPYHLPY
jgi:hypothetical protein